MMNNRYCYCYYYFFSEGKERKQGSMQRKEEGKRKDASREQGFYSKHGTQQGTLLIREVRLIRSFAYMVPTKAPD